jgi:hypothetical protein
MRRSKTHTLSAGRCGAAVESLERRQMLAGHPHPAALATAALDGDTLVIKGSGKSDVITVALNASDATKLDVTLNGVTTSFDLAAVAAIRADGGRGHDRVSIEGALTLHAELHGGAGNDSLAGGSGNDLLEGDNGKDDLDGGAGDDDCRGGNGKDSLVGGDGDDELHGGNGSDDLEGDGGNDRLLGENGDDDSQGGGGADTFDDRDDAGDLEEGDDLLVPYADLPAEVRSAFETHFAGAVPTEVKQEREDSLATYEVEFTLSGAEGEAAFDAAGHLLVG